MGMWVIEKTRGSKSDDSDNDKPDCECRGVCYGDGHGGIMVMVTHPLSEEVVSIEMDVLMVEILDDEPGGHQRIG